MSKIDSRILEILKEKTGMGTQSIRNAVSQMKRDICPRATQNAAAQLFARSKRLSVMKYLSPEDKSSLPSSIEMEKPARIPFKGKTQKKKRIKEFVRFKFSDPFLQAHLSEINKDYTVGSYTSAFILIRKVIENLLIWVLREKYPGRSKEERSLFYDFSRGRFLDFEDILSNLRGKAADFGPEKNLVELICKKSQEFKDDANDKTHSLYHIVKKAKELDDKEPQKILDMIYSLLNKLNTRAYPL